MRFLLMAVAAAILMGVSVYAEPSREAVMNVHSFTMKTIDGQDQSLADYKGKVLLIVNTASRCGFTPQYKSLEQLYQTYGERGLVVLGFPANDFMGQEPGTDAEIKNFCELKYKTTFPIFSKISVKGEDMHPLYRYLTKDSAYRGEISWNFNKFLVNPQGNVVARFGSRTDPLSQDVIKELEAVLPK